jgi:2-isopropylmalate synthase
VGGTYETVIRINSQSGKGGIAFLLEQDFGLVLPRRLQIEFARLVQGMADEAGDEMTSARIWESFKAEYLADIGPIDFISHRALPELNAGLMLTANIRANGEIREIEGLGNGPIDAYVDALEKLTGLAFEVVDYQEHSVATGADATAVAYVEVRTEGGGSRFGVGMHKNIVTASLRAVTSAANRIQRALQ